MKPIIKYRGGKSKEIPQILPYIPKFTGRYIEPFFGGGALFFYLEPQNAIINDINSNLITFYEDVKYNYPKIKKELSSIEMIYKKNRHTFDEIKALKPNDKVDDANEELYYKIRNMYNGLCNRELSFGSIYYFINKTAYSGMIRYNSDGHFNVPYGRYKNFNTSLLTEAHHNLLKNTEIFNCSYEDGFGEERHRKLAKDFRRLNCKSLMVIGKTPLTEELYGDLVVAEYEKSYAVNIKNRFKSESHHILVANYWR